MKLIRYTLLIALALNVACGRQGPPRPPEDFAPGRVANLRITADVDGVKLFWQTPETSATGGALGSLSSFVVKRAEDQTEGRLRYQELSKIAVEANAGKDTVYEYRDDKLTPGGRYVYYIEALNEDKVAGPASQALRVFFRGSSSVIER